MPDVGPFWPNQRGSCPHCGCPLHTHYHQCMFWSYPQDVAMMKYVDWIGYAQLNKLDVRKLHEKVMGDPNQLPPRA
eukprot:2483564-Alexandrium_andersonii.AAC.1